MTIHAFCQSVLRRFPLEAGVPPHFEVMGERDAAEMLDAAQNDLFAELHAYEDDPRADALREIVRRVHERQFPLLLAELGRERDRLAAMIERAGGLAPLVDRVYAELQVAPGATVQGLIEAASHDSAFDRAA